MISPTETLILSLLIQQPRGAFASELLHTSEGRLKRGSVYTILNRMEAAGLVSSKEEDPTSAYALPRTRYSITSAGIKARQDFANFTGLPVPVGAR
jgi:DNA-binding PadR family transcriptional regulator